MSTLRIWGGQISSKLHQAKVCLHLVVEASEACASLKVPELVREEWWEDGRAGHTLAVLSQDPDTSIESKILKQRTCERGRQG